MKHIIIESPDIGVGKSTLAKYLHKNIENSEIIEEKIEQELLEKLYLEIKTDAKNSKILEQCEASIFLNRAKQAADIALMNKDKVYIWDRCLVSSLAFSFNFMKNKNITPDGWLNIEKLFYNLDHFLRFNYLNTTLIHIEASLETLLERIKQRGREAEKDITKEYLQNIRDAYNESVWPYFYRKQIEKNYYNWEDYPKDKVLKDVLSII